MKTTVLFIFSLALSVVAHTNSAPDEVVSNAPPIYAHAGERTEQTRTDCIAGRRVICGRILKVLPGGLVVESGYTDLLRPALSKAWLVPGVTIAHRSTNLIESAVAGSPCVGVIYLRDLPKILGSGPRPRQHDYVVILGYPAGLYTYTSVGDIHKTVRQFSASLIKAVDINSEAETKSGCLPTKK